MAFFTCFDTGLDLSYHYQASILMSKDYYVVNKSFTFYFDNGCGRNYVKVPKGFLTDGASVPKMFWFFVPPIGRYAQATVIHDYLCEYGSLHNDHGSGAVLRHKTDAIFLLAMKALKVPTYKRWAMYVAVVGYRYLKGSHKPKKHPKKRLLQRYIRRSMIIHNDTLLSSKQMQDFNDTHQVF